MSSIELEQEHQEPPNHNHDRFIHRLPVEISAYIFEFCIPEEMIDLEFPLASSRYAICAPLILSAVCSRWRAIAYSTPRLWTAIPLRLRASDFCSFPTPILVKEWIDRAGHLPLSISIHLPYYGQRVKDLAVQIINVLNNCSNRWLMLHFDGPPSLLPHFSSEDQDLPQLRMLYVSPSGPTYFAKPIIRLRPKRLNTLSIASIDLISFTFDWSNLTQLEMTDVIPSDCVEALRRTPLLMRCIFRDLCEEDLVPDFPLPKHPIVVPKIQYLEICTTMDSLHYTEISHHISCPSLKTLMLNTDHEEVSIDIQFLKRSRCSLETLSFFGAPISGADVASLCQAITTLQHLRFEPLLEPSKLFACLAKFVIVEGRQEPQYLPALHSLYLSEVRLGYDDWAILPDIFGTPSSHSVERYRHALGSVKIITTLEQQELFAEETLRQILSLREAGVEWEMRRGEEEDIIQVAVDRYGVLSA